MAISISDLQYKNYGTCKLITNGKIELIVTTDVGPRVIAANLPGKKNLMFNDEARDVVNDVSSAFGEGKKWYIYGGHRIWISPEHMPLTYYPDNDPVKVAVDGNKITFTPPEQKVNNVQHALTIELNETDAEAKLTHTVTNTGDKPLAGAIWTLTVLDKNGTEICPQPDDDTGLLGNRWLGLWPYSRMTDDRVHFFDKYLTLTQVPSRHEKFKFALNNTKGWVAYQNYGQLLVKRYKPNHTDGIYPDNGMSTEGFTNEHFIEAETLSELKTLKKGETLTHVENWQISETPDLKITNEKSVEDFVTKFIK
ncbi:hypothetical protein FACS1894219_11630 [Clostridia bacterium]|nr:hypothetical protein FACS1894219_11630 [Clostridia bacterium]